MVKKGNMNSLLLLIIKLLLIFVVVAGNINIPKKYLSIHLNKFNVWCHTTSNIFFNAHKIHIAGLKRVQCLSTQCQ